MGPKNICLTISALLLGVAAFIYLQNSFTATEEFTPVKVEDTGQTSSPESAPPEKVTKLPQTPAVIAEINGDPISSKIYLRRLSEVIKQFEGSGGIAPADFEDIRKGALDGFLNEEILIRRAKAQNISVDPAKIEESLKAVKKNVADEGQNYDALLIARNQTEEQYKAELADQLMIEALVKAEVLSQIKVTDEDIKSYYDSNHEQFEAPETVKVAHILVAVKNDSTAEEKDNAKTKVKRIIDLMIGGADFGELAKKESDDKASAVNGGVMEFFPRGLMDPAFEKAAFETQVGKYSNVVLSHFGYHIIKVLGKKPASLTPFDEVKEDIHHQLLRDKTNLAMEDYLKFLKEEMKLKVLI